MAVYIFAYDLSRGPDRKYDYQPLWDELARRKAQRVQDSVWLVRSTLSAERLIEALGRFVHEKDRLWASQVGRNHFRVNAMRGTKAWLQANPPVQEPLLVFRKSEV